MDHIKSYLNSSIGRKQIVAITGVMLVLFLVGHLLGNLIIYLGPEAFNAYAKKLAGLRPGLLVVEVGLLVIFLIHVYYTATLVHENIRARANNYAVTQNETRSLATRLMPFTATVIFAFVIFHLMDFTFVDKEGPRGLINGENYHVFGIVYNAFKNPFHSLFYIVAMGCIGFHVAHGIQSTMQTFGFHSSKYTPTIKQLSVWLGWGIAVLFSSIPVAVLLDIIKV